MRTVIIYFLCIGISLAIFVFSYFWLDLSLGLMLASTHGYTDLIKTLIIFTQSNRQLLSTVYIYLIVFYFIIQIILFLKWANQISIKKLFILSAITSLIFSFSYNFLSYDIFSY